MPLMISAVSDTHQARVTLGPASGGLPAFDTADADQAALGRGLARMQTVRTDAHSGRILEADMTWQTGAPMAAGAGGRLALLLPVYNCRPLLERHMDGLRACLDLIDEVVVIDSDSGDGSAAFLAENLSPPCLRVVNHPRGLYASWNAGLALIRSKRVLIATAGDVMSRQGLAHLLETAETADADVTLSPPRICDADGTPNPQLHAWPIHEVLHAHPHSGPFTPGAPQLARWTMHFGGLCAGMLGSSASNLYRTRLLQQHPFPLDCGQAGDVAWGLRHLIHARVVITPEHCADFVLHTRPPGTSDAYARIQKQLFTHAALACGIEAESWIRQFRTYRDLELQCQSNLRRCRRQMGRAWLFYPPAWRNKIARNRYRRRITKLVLPQSTPGPFIDFWRTLTKQPQASRAYPSIFGAADGL